ncbi:MAG: DUF2971 domain-containing protein [Alphaproteobacteria bacterium]|nr:DUF2971 domain-containing protein [Alphaproteobacteria bacterium]
MIKVEGLHSEIFYHYTTIEAALSIIESSTLWLTHYRDLKDNKEIIRGFEIVQKELGKKFPTMPYAESLLDVRKHLPKEYYIFCLSPFADNEHLWKEYADNGKGVAIGFNAQNFLQFYFKDVKNKPCDIGPICYDPEEFRKKIDNALSVLKEPSFALVSPKYVVKKKNTNPIPNFPQFRDGMSRCLAESMLYKGARYRPEEEWRLIHCPEYDYDISPFEYKNKFGKRRAILHCKGLPIVEIKFRDANNKARVRVKDALILAGYESR